MNQPGIPAITAVSHLGHARHRSIGRIEVTDKSFHITVKFNGDGLAIDERNALLMAFERLSRERTGKDVRVYMDRMGDDSKLRVAMTPEQRGKL